MFLTTPIKNPKRTSKTIEEPTNQDFLKQIISYNLLPELKEQCQNLSKLRKITKRKKERRNATDNSPRKQIAYCLVNFFFCAWYAKRYRK